MSSDDLDLDWENEKLRRSSSYESVMSEVSVKGYSIECNEWNDSKIKEWSKKFREITTKPKTD